MPNIGEKTVANAFYQARLEASKHNDALSSREGAADIMSIDRGRIYRIESGITNPYPEEVLMMADLYNSPELRNYYCRNCCPLGETVPEVTSGSLDRITLKAVATMQNVYKTRDKLLEITADGIISEDEKEDLENVLKNLESIAQITEELRTWVKKNL